MAKKKGGLSRRQLQQMNKYTRLRRIYSGSKLLPGIYTYMSPEELEMKKIELQLQTGMPIVVRGVAGKKGAQKQKLQSRILRLGQKNSFIMATKAVEASTERVIGDLGVKILDVSAKPESVHTLGKMIAAKAIIMASTDGPKGRIGVGGVLASIGRKSIDVSVSPTGEISGPVTIGSVKKGSGPSLPRGGGGYFPSAPDGGSSGKVVAPVEGPSSKETKRKKDIEVGKTTIVKDEHGVTHIHIHSLNVYITADLVQQLNVNPQLVQNVLSQELTSLGEIVEKKALTQTETTSEEAANDEAEENAEEVEKKKKAKKDKK